MKKETLTTAVELGQMFTLLTPLMRQHAGAGKAFVKHVSQMRSKADDLMVAAHYEGSAAAEAHLAAMHTQVLEGIKANIDLPLLLKEERVAYPARIAKKGSGMARARNWPEILLGPLPGLFPRAKVADADRARLLHTYSSVVRNSYWGPLLHRLGIQLDVASVYSDQLSYVHGSHQGRENLRENVHSLCPTYFDAPRAIQVPGSTAAASGLYVLQACLSLERLMAHPEVAQLAAELSPTGKEPEGYELAKLLGDACRPVSLNGGEAADQAMQEVLDTLLEGLAKRKAIFTKERAAARRKAKEQVKAEAKAALQKLDPKLLKMLKANPDVLKDL